MQARQVSLGMMIGLAATALPVGAAQAAMFSFTDRVPTDDAFVGASSEANTNFGADTYLKAGAGSTDRRSYMQFDLDSSLAISSVSQALLEFSVDNDALGETLTITRLTEAFDEGTVTYNTRPSHDSSLVVTQVLPSSGNVPEVTIDVSSLLLQNGSMGTFGLRFNLTPDDGVDQFGFAKEATLSDSINPNLTVQYQTAVPEPATLALVGLGGLAMLSRKRRR